MLILGVELALSFAFFLPSWIFFFFFFFASLIAVDVCSLRLSSYVP